MAWTAARAEVTFCSGDCGRGALGGVQQPDEWRCLGEAGVGAAGAAVLPLATLHNTGNLQARHDREAAVPHLQGAPHQTSRFKTTMLSDKRHI